NDEIAKAENKEIDLAHAFKIAIEIEESMVEREFFKSMDSDAPFVEDVLKKIIADTEMHRDTLIQAKNIFLNKPDTIKFSQTTDRTTKTYQELQKDTTPDKNIELDRDLDNRNK
ncbi:MAG: hypothetical protein GQ534_01540, partial [Candidatus Delongbacteria bacterium]|nr:hypothetical protein [Candidatus Delongbacteria bacterium]